MIPKVDEGAAGKELQLSKLRELYKKYELGKGHIFKNEIQNYTLITRAGIDKIQAKAKIEIDYQPVAGVCTSESAVIKATATMGDVTIQTFGEATRNNLKFETNAGKWKPTYAWAIAEKRAMARAVLKLTGFYEEGVMSEDEAEEFKAFVNEKRSGSDSVKTSAKAVYRGAGAN